jgi:hypothetical protein
MKSSNKWLRMVRGARAAPQAKQFRICFVGNSHLAAVKLGWDVVGPHYPRVECLFYGASRRKMNDVIVDDGMLVPTSDTLAAELAQVSGGTANLRLNDFDAICLVGLLFGFLVPLGITQHFRTYSMFPLKKQSRLVSRACLRQIYRERMEGTIAIKLARMIRPASSAYLLLVQAPIPGEKLVSTDPWVHAPADQVRSSIAGAFEIYQSAVGELGASEGIRIISQPANTLSPNGLTRDEFSRGSARLESQTRFADDNLSHMNRDFGALMIREVMKAAGIEQAVAS